jgi:NAD(P)-dependent dehydrogenase (short-subunit alcohol dehydrogenase family)
MQRMQASRAVIVTGASSGIGLECARWMTGHGIRVFAGVRKPTDAERLEKLAPGAITAVILDVTDAASISAAVETVARRLGDVPLSGLVNNAGIAVAGPLEMLPLAEFRKQIEVNVVGQLAVTQAFLPLLKAGRGHIVIMGSILGKFALPFAGAYSCAKFALEALSESLGMELRGTGVSVSIIEPGNIATPIWEKSKGSALAMIGDTENHKWDFYRESGMAFMRYAERSSRTGISPQTVARVVTKALTARRPRRRYTVGWDSRILGRAIPALPPFFRQALVRSFVLRK